MEKKVYKEEFKKQLVMLYLGGKDRESILNEYSISRTSLNKWIRDFNNSGSFKCKDNRSENEQELIDLMKDNKRLKMENDILKQAALIMAQK